MRRPVGHLYDTYSLLRRPTRRARRATCEEVGCPAWRDGWAVPLVAVTPQVRADLREHGYEWREAVLTDGLAPDGWLHFPPGQRCLRSLVQPHHIEMDTLYLVRGGHPSLGLTGELRQHTRPEYWVEEFDENQSTLAAWKAQG